MEKRDPLKEVGNTPDHNDPQDIAGKELKAPEVTVVSGDKENGLFTSSGRSDPVKPDIGLDIECGSRPKETKLRLSFLKAFDPLYSESPEKSTVEKRHLDPPIRQQLIIEDSDVSDTSQLSPIPTDVSDDDAAFVDATYAADSNDDASDKQIEENKHPQLDESLLQFYTPEKLDTTVLKRSENIPKSTSSLADSETVLPKLVEPIFTSESDHPHIEKRKLHGSNNLHGKIHSPVVVPYKKQRITESEIVEAVRSKLQYTHIDINKSEEASVAVVSGIEKDTPEYEENKCTESKEADQKDKEDLISSDAEVGNVIEGEDSNSEISEIKTDSPDKSLEDKFDEFSEETFTGKKICSQEKYLELPETSDQSSKAELVSNTPNEKETVDASTSTVCVEKYPELPETTDESSGELLINKISEEAPKKTEEETVLTSSEKQLHAHNVEKSLEVSEILQELLKNITVEEDPKTTEEEEVIGKTTDKELCSQVSDIKKYPELPETSDETTDDSLVNKTVGEAEKTTEEETVEDKVNETVEEGPKVQDNSQDGELSEGKIDGQVIEKPAKKEVPQGPQDNFEGENFKESFIKQKEDNSDEQVSEVKLENSSKTEESLVSVEKEKSEPTSLEENVDVNSESFKSIEKEESAENSEEQVTLTHLEEIPLKSAEKVVSEEENTLTEEEILQSGDEVSDKKIAKELINSSTKQDTTIISTEEEVFEEKAEKESPLSLIEKDSLKSAEEDITVKAEENANTSFETHTPTEEKGHLDSGVESNEESYTKSPKSPLGVLEYSEKKQAEKNFEDEECKIESDGQVTLDEDTKTISEETDKNEQTKLLTETAVTIEPEKIESTGSQENLKTEDEKRETDSEKSVASKITFDIESFKSKMADLSEKLSEQQQENSDLKLQLNASQQAKASLELEIRQKEEIIIKTQAEALKNEQIYKQEIKQLREKLKENSKLIEKDSSKELEEQLKEAKARETKAIAELNQRNKDDLNYQKIMEEYENTISTRCADYQKLKEEHETATRHLANIELAFSDVHQKYERTKTLLEGYKSNEETLALSLQASEKTCKQHEERYESLKAHAKAQIEKSNKEILMLRDKYEMDINKLKAIIKRLEIKCGSLEVSLQQKTEECAALSALCDEVTGKRM